MAFGTQLALPAALLIPLLLIVGAVLFTGSFSIFSGWMLDGLDALGLPLLG